MCLRRLTLLLLLPLLEVGAAPTDAPDGYHSCLQLSRQGRPVDGTYFMAGLQLLVYCDMSTDGGGWTLLLTARTNRWDQLNVFGRQGDIPSLTDDYSILQRADQIRDFGSGQRFAYRIEAQVEKGRRYVGGIWLAPRQYSFVHWTDQQTDVALVRKFGNWTYDEEAGLGHRMPWLPEVGAEDAAVLTTSGSASARWWGTLVSSNRSRFHPSPFINHTYTDSGIVLYWIREEEIRDLYG